MPTRTKPKPAGEPTQWLTVDEAAKHARVSPALIYQAAQAYKDGKGGLCGVKLTDAPRSPWRFTAADVDLWLERGRVQPPSRRAS